MDRDPFTVYSPLNILFPPAFLNFIYISITFVYIIYILILHSAFCILHLTYSSLAQLAEHLTVNQVVAGSSPAGGANKKTIFRWSFLFATLGLEPMLKHTVRTKGAPLQSHSRKLSLRYTQLYLLLALWRKLRLKQLPIVFFLVSQQGEPKRKGTNWRTCHKAGL